MTTTAAGRRTPLWLGAALLLVAANLRLPLAAVPPVVDDISATLGLSSAAAGAITTLPVLCFGLAAPIAPVLGRRYGDERVVLACLLAVVGGVAIRLVPEAAPFYAGTLLLGLGIALVNVLVPALLKQWYPRPGGMTGLYVTLMAGGAALAAGTTVPLDDAFGGWTWALAVWGVPSALAAVVWLPVIRASRTTPAADRRRVSVRRQPVAWLLTGMMGTQSLLFYSFLAWTPEILADSGLDEQGAGAMLSVAMVFGIPAALLFPFLAGRRADQRSLVAMTGGLWIAALAGLLAAPAAATPAWMVLAGLGQGGTLALTMILVVLRAENPSHAAALSGMVQALGYLLAASGPSAVGLIHDATGSWTPAIAFLLVIAVAYLASGFGAARRRSTGSPY